MNLEFICNLEIGDWNFLINTKYQNTMELLLTNNYNLINPKIQKLVGYDSENYLVENGSEKFILKVIPNEKNKVDFAQAENEVLVHLQKNANNKFPAPVKNKNDEFITAFESENSSKTARLLTFIEGEFLAKAKHTTQLFESFGKFLAEMDLDLKDFQNLHNCSPAKQMGFAVFFTERKIHSAHFKSF